MANTRLTRPELITQLQARAKRRDRYNLILVALPLATAHQVAEELARAINAEYVDFDRELITRMEADDWDYHVEAEQTGDLSEGRRLAQALAADIAGRQERGQKFSLDHLIVLSHLRRHREIGWADTARICQRTEREADEILSEMVTLGLLEKGGPRRGPTYQLSRAAYESMGQRVGYIRDRGINRIRDREMVLEYVRQFGAITNTQCQELCGLSRKQATRLLNRLVEHSDLKVAGKGRGTHYMLPNTAAS